MNTSNKERFWIIEYEERDPASPGWHPLDVHEYSSESKAIEEAKNLAALTGTFYKAFQVVEVNVETNTTVIEEFKRADPAVQVQVPRSKDETLIEALEILVVEMDSDDGVASTVIAESAKRLLDLTQGIKEVLEDNRHLADGDDCTLIKLKKLVPEWN
jgi:hypothetical protein